MQWHLFSNILNKKKQCSLNYKLAWKAKKASSHSSDNKAKKKRKTFCSNVQHKGNISGKKTTFITRCQTY